MKRSGTIVRRAIGSVAVVTLGVAGIVFSVGNVGASTRPHAASAATAAKINFVGSWSSPSVLALPVVIGLERGLYAAAGIDLNLVLPPTNSTDEQMVGIGQAQLGASTNTDMVDARQAGLPIISIANESAVNNWGIFYNPSTKLTAANFANGGIGGYGDTFTNAMLPFFYKYFGIKTAKVVTVTNDDIPLMIDHKIMFATSCTNFGAVEYKQTTGHAAGQLLATKVGAPNSPIWIYIGNTSWLKTHKALTTAFLNATLAATKWASANPASAVQLYDSYFKVTYNTYKHNLGEWEATAAVMKSSLGYFVAQASQWSELASALKGIGSLKTVYPADQYFTNAYIGNK